MISPSFTSDAQRVNNAATAVLDAVNASALALSVPLPTEKYLTSGAPVFDCEQVAVTVTGLRTGLPASGNFPTGGVPGSAAGGAWCAPAWTLNITVSIVRRCAPTPNRSGGVSKKALTATVAQSSADAAVLMGIPDAIPNNWANMDITVQLGGVEGGMVSTVATIGLTLS